MLLRTMMMRVVMVMVKRMLLLLVMVMRMVAVVSRQKAGAFSVGESYLASGLSVRHCTTTMQQCVLKANHSCYIEDM